MTYTSKIIELGKNVNLEMVYIPGGRFLMGSPQNEVGRCDDEGPQHEVSLAPFWMAKYPITQAQWRVVASLPPINCELNPNPSYIEGDDCPVEQVNWYEVMEFCARLSVYTSQTYTLPSEAQWEYACRAGTTTPYHFGETISQEQANYLGTAETTEVGSFPQNNFGLCDMHGNVFEWCLDYRHSNYKGAPVDGSAWTTGGDSNLRMLRGGAWVTLPKYCRCAYRGYSNPVFSSYFTGFRIMSMHL